MRKFDLYMFSFLRLVLWPFSLIYGLIIRVRNGMYDRGIFKSTTFSFPVIVIGNLAVGGTGKSPMTEFLIRLLNDKYKIATLSRGYGRNTSGFLYVNRSDSPQKVGDEPLQFKSKFPGITVAVCEDRVFGLKNLQGDHQVVILDDAYQHRALTPGLSILLIEYQSLLQTKLLLPAGDFRDTFSQRKRADIIIVSKCPYPLVSEKEDEVLARLKARTNQSVFFSYLKYDHPYTVFVNESKQIPITIDDDILLVTGIANPQPLEGYLQSRCKSLKSIQYSDHHNFSERDIHHIIDGYNAIRSLKKYILTTEKDYQRLKEFSHDFTAVGAPEIRVISIETSFHNDGKMAFSSLVHQYCKENIS